MSMDDKVKKDKFEKLFDDRDDIVILQGVIEFQAQEGKKAVSYPDEFLRFIQHKLHFSSASSQQVVNKIYSLKKRFQHAKNNRQKVRRHHSKEVFDLANQIWGDDGNSHFQSNLKLHQVAPRLVSCKRDLTMTMDNLGDLESLNNDAAFKRKRRKLAIQEMQVRLQRLELIRETVQAVLNALKSDVGS